TCRSVKGISTTQTVHTIFMKRTIVSRIRDLSGPKDVPQFLSQRQVRSLAMSPNVRSHARARGINQCWPTPAASTARASPSNSFCLTIRLLTYTVHYELSLAHSL